jgi:hypothetical protein
MAPMRWTELMIFPVCGTILCLFLLKGKKARLFFAFSALLIAAFLWFSGEPARKGKSPLRTNEKGNVTIVKMEGIVQIDVPAISQFPELERGCEVTSLAMLLNHAGIRVNKMELAAKVKKNPEKMKISGGTVYFGDPNDGFVGDIYSKKNPGLGVYHGPIAELARQYLPKEAVLDLTGSDFERIKMHLSHGFPVWVIVSINFRPLDESDFETWMTPNGKIKITYKEHSVLVTGYSDDTVFFNDPYDGQKKEAPANEFIAAWKQLGSQAITYQTPKEE